MLYAGKPNWDLLATVSRVAGGNRTPRLSHNRFGGRARETDRLKGRHRALVRPNYYCLEGLFDELWLCNARHMRNVPGRKTDQLTELREGFACLALDCRLEPLRSGS